MIRFEGSFKKNQNCLPKLIAMKSLDWAVHYSLAGYTFGIFFSEEKNKKKVEKSQSQSYF